MFFSSSASVVIGAPKANTSQVNVAEGGSVFYCPWSTRHSDCHTIEFDSEGKHCSGTHFYNHVLFSTVISIHTKCTTCFFKCHVYVMIGLNE